MAGAVIHRQKARRRAFFVVLGDPLRLPPPARVVL